MDKPKITTWETYKKNNEMKETTPIYKLKEQGFDKLPLAKRKSSDDRKPREVVEEAIKGKDFSVVIYETNEIRWERGFTISIYAK